jgi:hypothetical protein
MFPSHLLKPDRVVVDRKAHPVKAVVNTKVWML